MLTVCPGLEGKLSFRGVSPLHCPAREGGTTLAVGVERVAESKWQAVGGRILWKIFEMANLLSGGGWRAGHPDAWQNLQRHFSEGRWG